MGLFQESTDAMSYSRLTESESSGICPRVRQACLQSGCISSKLFFCTGLSVIETTCREIGRIYKLMFEDISRALSFKFCDFVICIFTVMCQCKSCQKVMDRVLFCLQILFIYLKERESGAPGWHSG